MILSADKRDRELQMTRKKTEWIARGTRLYTNEFIAAAADQSVLG